MFPYIVPCFFAVFLRLFPVDCGWSSWTQWSACSRTCDVGVRRRYRSGTNPLAAFGGRPCKGDRVGIDTCSIEPCFGQFFLWVFFSALITFRAHWVNTAVISLKALRIHGPLGRSARWRVEEVIGPGPADPSGSMAPLSSSVPVTCNPVVRQQLICHQRIVMLVFRIWWVITFKEEWADCSIIVL